VIGRRIFGLVILVLLSCTGKGELEGMAADPNAGTGERELKVVVLSIPKCAATAPTIALVESALGEVGLKAEVENIFINNQDEANQHRFLGSPTVQVNGLDIDPAMRSTNTFGVA